MECDAQKPILTNTNVHAVFHTLDIVLMRSAHKKILRPSSEHVGRRNLVSDTKCEETNAS